MIAAPRVDASTLAGAELDRELLCLYDVHACDRGLPAIRIIILFSELWDREIIIATSFHTGRCIVASLAMLATVFGSTRASRCSSARSRMQGRFSDCNGTVSEPRGRDCTGRGGRAGVEGRRSSRYRGTRRPQGVITLRQAPNSRWDQGVFVAAQPRGFVPELSLSHRQAIARLSAPLADGVSL